MPEDKKVHHYFKVNVYCGFVGTEEEIVFYSEAGATEREIEILTRELWYERCGEYYWKPVTKDDYDEAVEDGYADEF